VVIDILAAGAASAVPVAVQGWTWAATTNAINGVLIAGGGSGLAALLIKALIQLKRIGNERATQEDVRDGARWKELMEFNERLQKRVDTLEQEAKEERRRCEEQLDELRRDMMEMVRQTAAATAATFTVARNTAKALPLDMQEQLDKMP